MAAGSDAEGDRHSPDAAREAVLTLIERRRRTRADLHRRLRGRGFPVAVIDPVLDRLQEVGLVDDQDYAEAFLRDRLRFRPRSVRLLRTELRQRGIADDVADRALAALGEETGDVHLACHLLASRAARLGRLEPEECRRRATNLLRRNGFSWDVIREALAAWPAGE